MHSAVAAFYVLVASFGVHVPAQEPDRHWTELERSQGLTVAIEVSDGSRVHGTLLRVDGASVLLRDGASEQRIDRRQIRRITSKRRDSLKNGIVTGAIIGAGMAAGSSCSIGDRKCGTGGRVAFIAFGAALWSAIGAAIDAGMHKRITLYEVAPTP
jgi:small nuclear ribonucleoprotein (snRNP)-like protein